MLHRIIRDKTDRRPTDQTGKYGTEIWGLKMRHRHMRARKTQDWKMRNEIYFVSGVGKRKRIFWASLFSIKPILCYSVLIILLLLYLPAIIAVVFSEREFMFMFAVCYRPSVCLSSVICRLSVCNVRAPYSGDEIFGNDSKPFGTLSICDLSIKILRRSSQGNPSVVGLNRRGVAKCSNFGPFQSYISETVQDMR